MHIDQLQQLSEWLVATDIAVLELRGPGVHIRLRHDGARIDLIEDPTPADIESTSAPVPALIAAAASVGVFLHKHPLNDLPLARPGATVRTGQVLGLLQIGSLLLPVNAPRDAMVIGPLVAHGESVGFGTPLLELEPLDEAP